MSMRNNEAKEPIVYVRRRKKKETEEVVANVIASSAQQDISWKEIGETSSKTLRPEPNKLLENKEAKTVKKGRTKYCSNSSILNTRQSKGGGAGNDKIISDNREENRKTWKPLDESKKESLLVQPTHEETNGNQLALVHDRNIDHVSSQLDFSKDMGETAQRLAHTRVWESTFDADQKGEMIHRENNDNMNLDCCAQRGNKGITICEKSVNSRSEEMATFLGTSNDHSRGQNLQLQNMNQVSPNNFLKEMSRPNHKPRIIVHPSKIIGPSRFSPNYDQNMQRTSVSVPHNFSLMKLLMENENSSTLTDQELLYAKDLLRTNHGLSLEGQRVQQWPYSQVGNYQNMRRTPESATSNFSYMKLLMEGEESCMLTNDLYEKQPLSTQYSLSIEGQRVQQLPISQLGNYHFEDSSEEQRVQQLSFSQVGNYQSKNLSEGQKVQQFPISQVGNYQFGNSSAGQMVQQWPCGQVGNSPFDNPVQLNCQNQVLPQSQEISFRELLARDDISYMDLLTRKDLIISWT